MRVRAGNYSTAACLLAFVFTASLPAQVKALPWQTGHVLSYEINGHGASSEAKVKRSDVWWTYSICTGDRTYVAVLRESPAVSGLTEGSPVKFYTDRNQLIYLDPAGKRHVLRIIRQNKGKLCR
ncbi:MAG: hypothetical protein LAP85_26790 [Acidobacteriia bacterium]|nr:hypothetical protein [Terriglobia bacterium]